MQLRMCCTCLPVCQVHLPVDHHTKYMLLCTCPLFVDEKSASNGGVTSYWKTANRSVARMSS